MQKDPFQNFWKILLAIAAVGVGSALILGSDRNPIHLKYEQEWVRVLLQVGLVAIAGIVTSLVLERFKDALQQRRDISRLRFDVLNNLSQTYNDVKLVRRKLQNSNLVFTDDDVNELNQLQLQIELHKRVNVSSFRQENTLFKYLDIMEKYLNRAANNPGSKERAGFCTKPGFKVFSKAFEKALKLIKAEISNQ